jgi:hypothetical protein
MKLIPNFINNAEEIVQLCEQYSKLFKPRIGGDTHGGFLPNIKSKFNTLKNDDMPDDFFHLIFSTKNKWDIDTCSFWSFIQIQRYDIGDYIVPHRDAYFVKKLHLVTLTSSECDGLVCETKDHDLIYISDIAGQYIDFPYDSIHFVPPVKQKRYSLVIGM